MKTALTVTRSSTTPRGRPRPRRFFGDGIEHVQATSAGEIWVGFFDEGIYGNYGWGSGTQLPVGRTGLVRFSPTFSPTEAFPSMI
jgi:hypothetical protein